MAAKRYRQQTPAVQLHHVAGGGVGQVVSSFGEAMTGLGRQQHQISEIERQRAIQAEQPIQDRTLAAGERQLERLRQTHPDEPEVVAVAWGHYVDGVMAEYEGQHTAEDTKRRLKNGGHDLEIRAMAAQEQRALAESRDAGLARLDAIAGSLATMGRELGGVDTERGRELRDDARATVDRLVTERHVTRAQGDQLLEGIQQRVMGHTLARIVELAGETGGSAAATAVLERELASLDLAPEDKAAVGKQAASLVTEQIRVEQALAREIEERAKLESAIAKAALIGEMKVLTALDQPVDHLIAEARRVLKPVDLINFTTDVLLNGLKMDTAAVKETRALMMADLELRHQDEELSLDEFDQLIALNGWMLEDHTAKTLSLRNSLIGRRVEPDIEKQNRIAAGFRAISNGTWLPRNAESQRQIDAVFGVAAEIRDRLAPVAGVGEAGPDGSQGAGPVDPNDVAIAERFASDLADPLAVAAIADAVLGTGIWPTTAKEQLETLQFSTNENTIRNVITLIARVSGDSERGGGALASLDPEVRAFWHELAKRSTDGGIAEAQLEIQRQRDGRFGSARERGAPAGPGLTRQQANWVHGALGSRFANFFGFGTPGRPPDFDVELSAHLERHRPHYQNEADALKAALSDTLEVWGPSEFAGSGGAMVKFPLERFSPAPVAGARWLEDKVVLDYIAEMSGTMMSPEAAAALTPAEVRRRLLSGEITVEPAPMQQTSGPNDTAKPRYLVYHNRADGMREPMPREFEPTWSEGQNLHRDLWEAATKWVDESGVWRIDPLFKDMNRGQAINSAYDRGLKTGQFGGVFSQMALEDEAQEQRRQGLYGYTTWSRPHRAMVGAGSGIRGALSAAREHFGGPLPDHYGKAVAERAEAEAEAATARAEAEKAAAAAARAAAQEKQAAEQEARTAEANARTRERVAQAAAEREAKAKEKAERDRAARERHEDRQRRSQ